VLTAGFLIWLGGCGGPGVETVTVRGRITYGGGDWPKPGTAYFTPADPAPGMPLRPAPGNFDTSGNLSVVGVSCKKDLVPGKYKIGIECWEVEPSMENPQAAKSYVPPKYQSPQTSGLEVTVQPGQRYVDVNFDIPKP